MFSCTLPSSLTATSTYLCLQYVWDPQKQGRSYIYSWKSCVCGCCLARDLSFPAHSLPLCWGSIIRCWRAIGAVVSSSAASEDSSWICNMSNCWPHLCWARVPCWGAESCWPFCLPMFSMWTLAAVHCMVPAQLCVQTEEREGYGSQTSALMFFKKPNGKHVPNRPEALYNFVELLAHYFLCEWQTQNIAF